VSQQKGAGKKGEENWRKRGFKEEASTWLSLTGQKRAEGDRPTTTKNYRGTQRGETINLPLTRSINASRRKRMLGVHNPRRKESSWTSRMAGQVQKRYYYRGGITEKEERNGGWGFLGRKGGGV